MNFFLRKVLTFCTKQAKTLKNIMFFNSVINYTFCTKWNLLTATAFSVEKFVFPLHKRVLSTLTYSLNETVYIKGGYIYINRFKSSTNVFLTKKETSVILM